MEKISFFISILFIIYISEITPQANLQKKSSRSGHAIFLH